MNNLRLISLNYLPGLLKNYYLVKTSQTICKTQDEKVVSTCTQTAVV